MRMLLSGGCKMGKSTLAQHLCALQGGQLFYIATMRPRDDEDIARIARHRAERAGWGFETIECAKGIESVISMLPQDASVLLDSTTALLAEEMFSAAGAFDDAAGERVLAGLIRVADAVPNLVVVSDAIYADGRAFDAMTEAYRRALAAIDRALAARFDGVIEVAFGIPIIHKGGEAVAGLLQKASVGAVHGAGDVHGGAGVCPLG